MLRDVDFWRPLLNCAPAPPVLVDEGKGPQGNSWGISFMTMFHMANDSHCSIPLHSLGQRDFRGSVPTG
jgi:hypothetical protein